MGEYATFSQYRTRGGALVPLIVSSGIQHLGIFVLESSDQVDRSKIASAESFLKKHDHAKVVFAVRSGREAHALGERMMMVPLGQLVF